MREKNTTESVTRHEIKELIRKYWSLLNGEITGNSALEKYLRIVAFNIAYYCLLRLNRRMLLFVFLSLPTSGNIYF
jgi:hypothetical protein